MPLADTAFKKAKPGTKPIKLSDSKGLYPLFGISFRMVLYPSKRPKCAQGKY